MFKLQDTPDEIVTKWNDFAVKLLNERGIKLPKVRVIDAESITKKLQTDGFDFDAILNEISNSDFLLGISKSKRKWTVSFDWVFKCKGNWRKIINQNYRNDNGRKQLVTSEQRSNRTENLMRTASVFQQIKDNRR